MDGNENTRWWKAPPPLLVCCGYQLVHGSIHRPASFNPLFYSWSRPPRNQVTNDVLSSGQWGRKYGTSGTKPAQPRMRGFAARTNCRFSVVTRRFIDCRHAQVSHNFVALPCSLGRKIRISVEMFCGLLICSYVIWGSTHTGENSYWDVYPSMACISKKSIGTKYKYSVDTCRRQIMTFKVDSRTEIVTYL